MSSAPDPTGRLLGHQRLVVAASIALLVASSWAFLVKGAGMTTTMAGMQPPFGALVLMWWLMMVAMMLPSAAPAILLYARVREQRHASGAIAAPSVFLGGYLATWLLFSILAAAAQHFAAGGTMSLADSRWTSALLIAAGLYQLSPLKSACLSQCRSPAQFLSRYWRPGTIGAVRLGVLHGAYCVGCCWLLMALLFVVGVMNLLWVVALTALIATEKLLAHGAALGRAAGIALIVWGAVRLTLG